MFEAELVKEIISREDIQLPLDLGDFSSLQEEVEAGNISVDYAHGLALYNYTKKGVFRQHKLPIIKVCRGLILDINALWNGNNADAIAALPFPAFLDARYLSVTKSPVQEITVKMDGALAILYRVKDKICWATRHRFDSKVTKVAQQIWKEKYARKAKVPSELTLLCEVIHPLTRVLVSYDFYDLFLIGARDRFTGKDLAYEELYSLGKYLGMPVVEQVDLTIKEALKKISHLTTEQEGYIIRLHNGTRVKLSNEIYNGVYDLLSDCTPWLISEIWGERLNPYALLQYIPSSQRQEISKTFEELDSELKNLEGQFSVEKAEIDLRAEAVSRYRMRHPDLYRVLFRILPEDV